VSTSALHASGSFEEAGFCPHDGTPLAVSAPHDAQTLLSERCRAGVADGRRAAAARVPLTPTPPASAHTQDVTAARTRLAEAPAPRVIRAVSASDDPQAALAAYRATRTESEYDKLVGRRSTVATSFERKIGEGGMGVVFAARHAVIERPLAIKVLKREVMRDTATIKRFVKEAQAASRIGHPNIVDVTDFGTTSDGMTFSVMEYIDGRPSAARSVTARRSRWRRAIRIAVQIARALGAAHEKGIVHRDLKPENVFLLDRENRTDFVKIVDFASRRSRPRRAPPIRTSRASRAPAPCSARPNTWRPSRPPAAATPTAASTSTRSA